LLRPVDEGLVDSGAACNSDIARSVTAGRGTVEDEAEGLGREIFRVEAEPLDQMAE
jgi:hypothetical protein